MTSVGDFSRCWTNDKESLLSRLPDTILNRISMGTYSRYLGISKSVTLRSTVVSNESTNGLVFPLSPTGVPFTFAWKEGWTYRST